MCEGDASKQPRERPSCYDKAVDLLARRAHFRLELERKLAQRRYPISEIDSALARLEERGYVDDRQTARHWAELRRERDGYGRRRLAAELRRRGVGDEVIDETLAPFDESSEEELARRAAQRWLRRGRRERTALARHLERRGFGPRVIFAILDDCAEQLDSEPSPPEAPD